MENKIVKPFVEATVKVLETMAFVTPTVGETGVWDQEQAVGEVVGIVGLSNEEENIKGFMSIGFSESSIVQIVSSMFGEEFDTINDEVREAAGEIANMISGQVRQTLSNSGTKLQAALPSVISGKDLTMQCKKPMTIVRFQVNKGPFELGICIDGLG
jgi:chemotaxis protein CheX